MPILSCPQPKYLGRKYELPKKPNPRKCPIHLPNLKSICPTIINIILHPGEKRTCNLWLKMLSDWVGSGTCFLSLNPCRNTSSQQCRERFKVLPGLSANKNRYLRAHMYHFSSCQGILFFSHGAELRSHPALLFSSDWKSRCIWMFTQQSLMPSESNS